MISVIRRRSDPVWAPISIGVTEGIESRGSRQADDGYRLANECVVPTKVGSGLSHDLHR
jgi:hypothetical protein